MQSGSDKPETTKIPNPTAPVSERALIDAAVDWYEMRFASVPLRMTQERKLIAAIIAVREERAAHDL